MDELLLVLVGWLLNSIRRAVTAVVRFARLFLRARPKTQLYIAAKINLIIMETCLDLMDAGVIKRPKAILFLNWQFHRNREFLRKWNDLLIAHGDGFPPMKPLPAIEGS